MSSFWVLISNYYAVRLTLGRCVHITTRYVTTPREQAHLRTLSCAASAQRHVVGEINVRMRLLNTSSDVCCWGRFHSFWINSGRWIDSSETRNQTWWTTCSSQVNILLMNTAMGPLRSTVKSTARTTAKRAVMNTPTDENGSDGKMSCRKTQRPSVLPFLYFYHHLILMNILPVWTRMIKRCCENIYTYFFISNTHKKINCSNFRR